MQNDIHQITTCRSKSKPEVQFQYGGLPFSETRSSFISPVDCDISSKFGTQIDFHFLKRMQSLTLNTEVHVPFGFYGLHLKKSIRRNNTAGDRLIKTKFGRLMQNHMPMATHRSKSKQEIEFQYGGHPFSETGSCFIWTVNWDISSKYGMQIDFYHFERMHVTKPELGIIFPTLWPPSWKIDMTSGVRRCSSDY